MSAGKVAAEFILQQLTYMRARRDNVEARGISLINTSGAVVSLGLAFLGVLAPKKELSNAQFASACCTLAAFAFASICGVLVNRPRRTPDAVQSGGLLAMLSEEHWGKPEEKAQRAIAEVHVALLQETAKSVDAKGKWLRRGFIFEVAGIVLLGATILLTIRNR